MISGTKLEIVRTKGPQIGRILIGLAFFVFGASMFMAGPENSAGFYTTVGIPLAGVMVWVVAILKVGAGIAIMSGRYVTEASAALIIFVLAATLLVHMDFGDPMQLNQAMKNLAIVGGLLYLMAYGPGGIDVKGDGIRD
jgi:putative oxidoreductase